MEQNQFENVLYGQGDHASSYGYEGVSKPGGIGGKVNLFTPPSGSWGKLKLNLNKDAAYDDEDSDSERSGTPAFYPFFLYIFRLVWFCVTFRSFVCNFHVFYVLRCRFWFIHFFG